MRNFTSPAKTNVDFVRSKKFSGKSTHVKTKTNVMTTRPQGGQSMSTRKCEFCGRSYHPRATCPAREASCFKCRRVGHFGAVCRASKSVDTVIEHAEEDVSFLGEVKRGKGQPWTSTISLQVKESKRRTDICFKLDTGADATVISGSDYRRADSPAIEKTSMTLVGADDRVLPAKGKFVDRLSRGGRRT